MIPVARPVVGEEEISAVAEVMRSGMLARGSVVAEFESRFADYCGAAHAIGVNSGTAALHAALLAAGIRRDNGLVAAAFPVRVRCLRHSNSCDKHHHRSEQKNISHGQGPLSAKSNPRFHRSTYSFVSAAILGRGGL